MNIKYCRCGCGENVTRRSMFRRGHNLRIKNPMDNSESIKKVFLNRGVKTTNRRKVIWHKK